MTRSFILTATFVMLAIPAIALPTASAGPAGDALDTVDGLCGSPIVAVVDHPPGAGNSGPWPHACDRDYYGNRDYQGDPQGLWIPLIDVSACDAHQNSTFYGTIGQALHDKPLCSPTPNEIAHQYATQVDDALQS